MNMNIILTYDTLYATVERSLSVIGKRSADDDGNRLFTDITLGSREKEIVHDYFRQAVIDLAAETAAYISAGSKIFITLEFPDNHNAALEPFISESCSAYCVSYALFSWFTITAPRISAKYLEDCKRQLAAVVRLTHAKQAPSGSIDVLSTSTRVS